MVAVVLGAHSNSVYRLFCWNVACYCNSPIIQFIKNNCLMYSRASSSFLETVVSDGCPLLFRRKMRIIIYKLGKEKEVENDFFNPI